MEHEDEMTRNKYARGLAPFGLVLLSSGAMAQQSVVEHCRATSSDADRIACLEAALLAKDPDNTTPAPPPLAAPVKTSSPEPETTPVGIGADQVVARNMTRDEHLESLEKAKGLVVTAYTTVPYEKLQITLENGQIWRQINGDTQKIRVDLKRNQTVDIEESSISGYKMQLNEIRRSVRVERVR